MQKQLWNRNLQGTFKSNVTGNFTIEFWEELTHRNVKVIKPEM